MHTPSIPSRVQLAGILLGNSMTLLVNDSAATNCTILSRKALALADAILAEHDRQTTIDYESLYGVRPPVHPAEIHGNVGGSKIP